MVGTQTYTELAPRWITPLQTV